MPTGAKSERSDRMGALVAAAVAAWATIAAVVLLLFVIPGIWFNGPLFLPFVASVILPAVVFGFVFASIVTAIIGWPALFLAESLQLTRWWHATLIGGASGLLVGAIPVFTTKSPQAFPLTMAFMLVCVVAGAPAGLAAWNVRWREKRVA